MRLNGSLTGGMGVVAICGACLLASGCESRERHVTVIEQPPPRAVVVQRPAPVIVEHHRGPAPVVVEHRPVVVERRPVVVEHRPVVVERRPVVVEHRRAPVVVERHRGPVETGHKGGPHKDVQPRRDTKPQDARRHGDDDRTKHQ